MPARPQGNFRSFEVVNLIRQEVVYLCQLFQQAEKNGILSKRRET